MKIVHICLNCPFTENWGYQENVLPRYHKELGNDVTVIATNMTHLVNNSIVETKVGRFLLDDGVQLIRIKKKKCILKKIQDVFSPYDISDLLIELKPNLIMIHGFMGSISTLQVKKYVKKVNKTCKVVVDIHEDYSNSIYKKGIKYKMRQYICRLLNKKMYNIYEKIFYVAPSAKLYAEKYYKAPLNKLEILPLGCDTELINLEKTNEYRENLIKRTGFDKDDILISHGGKLSEEKKTVELLESIKILRKTNKKVKLILFGSIVDNYKDNLLSKIEQYKDFVFYFDFFSPNEYYKIFIASDIVIFPGGQSVLWQQAIACGAAVAVKRHYGIDYLDLGGNLEIIEEATVCEILKSLNNMIENNNFIEMKKIAISKGVHFFSYERIAKKVLEIVNEAYNEQ